MTPALNVTLLSIIAFVALVTLVMLIGVLFVRRLPGPLRPVVSVLLTVGAVHAAFNLMLV